MGETVGGERSGGAGLTRGGGRLAGRGAVGVSPRVTGLFLRAAAAAPAPPLPRAPAGPARRFSTEAALAVSGPAEPSAPEELLRRRVAMQRASKAWAALLGGWHAAPPSARGVWCLADLIDEVEARARDLAARGTPVGASDERLVFAWVSMLGRSVAGALLAHGREGTGLPRNAVAAMARDLRAIAEGPVAGPLREPDAPMAHVAGATSLALTRADVAARLLPHLLPHAGLAAARLLDEAMARLWRRAESLVDAVGGAGLGARERQGLVQSMSRREAEIMAAVLAGLPPAGPGMVAAGAVEFERALARYEEVSERVAETIGRLLPREAPVPRAAMAEEARREGPAEEVPAPR